MLLIFAKVINTLDLYHAWFVAGIVINAKHVSLIELILIIWHLAFFFLSIAEIVVAVQPQLKVKFLRHHHTRTNVFVYPEVDDVQIVEKDMIVKHGVDLVPLTRFCREWRVRGFAPSKH